MKLFFLLPHFAGFPKITDIIIDPSDAEYGIPFSLTCKVLDFYPKDINIQWFHGDDLISKDVLTEWSAEAQMDTFSLLSKLRLEPTALDYDKEICFKVMHKKLTKPITKSLYLKLPGMYHVVSFCITIKVITVTLNQTRAK